MSGLLPAGLLPAGLLLAAGAGATWWLEALYLQRDSLERPQAAIRKGPPKKVYLRCIKIETLQRSVSIFTPSLERGVVLQV